MGKRDPALEIFRGIAICEVVIHHVTSFARLNLHPATLTNFLYTAANRSLHFAVPAFLFLMGVLLSHAMRDENRTWSSFYRRRGQQTFFPYLLWSGIYVVFALSQGKITPAEARNWQSWGHWLLWGKAWFHLYFLVLALQLYLVLPLLILAMQRSRVRFPLLLAWGAALQLAVYGINFHWLKVPYPSTLLAWHLLPTLAGVWIGLHFEEWDRTWVSLRYGAVLLLVGGWLWYLPQGIRELRGQPVDTLWYQVAFWSYTLGVCFCLLTFCRWLVRRGARWRWLPRGLQVLGAQSMQIYLVHPMLLFLWYTMPQTGSTLRYHCTVLLVILGALGISLLAARTAVRLGVASFLFGRGDMSLAPLPGLAGNTQPAAER